VKKIFSKVTADLAPTLRPHAVWLLRNGFGVQLARAVVGQLKALMMVSVEAPGWWESPVRAPLGGPPRAGPAGLPPGHAGYMTRGPKCHGVPSYLT